MDIKRFIPPIITDFLISKSIPNLLGDRLIEWSWSASRIPENVYPYNHALDLGTGSSYISLIAALKEWSVTCIDLSHAPKPYSHDNISYVNGDILTMPLDLDKYNLVINVSFIEHVGNPGKDKGDLIAMNRIYQAMTDNSIMLLTVPCGKNPGNPGLARCYNDNNLKLLASRFSVLEQSYYAKINGNIWTEVVRDTACNYPNNMKSTNPLNTIYALGMLVLHKPGETVNATGTISPEL